MNIDKIETRIIALMAHADSTTHPEEAQAFYAKAEELMLQHAIDRATLEAKANGSGNRRPEEDVVVVRIPFNRTKRNWKALGVYGSTVISKAIGLTGVSINNRNGCITLYGRESDTRHVRTVIEAAWRQAERHLSEWRKYDPSYLYYWGIRDSNGCNRCLDGFVYGFCEGAASKIREARESFIERTNGAELVLAGVKDKIDEALGALPKSRMRDPRFEDRARWAGYEAGLTANLVEELDR